MRDLNIESDKQLFLMMAGAGLPMPSPPEEETRKMAEKFRKVLGSWSCSMRIATTTSVKVSGGDPNDERNEHVGM